MSLLLVALVLSSCAAPEALPGFPLTLTPSDLRPRADAVPIADETGRREVAAPYHLQAFALERQRIFGVRARVELTFFNERLLRVAIFPENTRDLDRVREGLARYHRFNAIDWLRGVRREPLRLEEYVDVRRRTYLSVIVAEVSSQRDAWILRHA